MKNRLLGLLGSVLASALFASAAQAQLVNGSFEANSQANGTWNIYSNPANQPVGVQFLSCYPAGIKARQ